MLNIITSKIILEELKKLNSVDKQLIIDEILNLQKSGSKNDKHIDGEYSNKFKRVIIFSPTIEESYKYGDIQYNSKLSDKQKFEALKHINFPSPILVSAVNDISHEIKSQFDVEIITCNNSSNILKENRLKLIKDEGKIFTFVIKNTMEEAWYKLSTLDNDYITITEKMLQRVLDGKEILEERIEGPEMIFNY